MNDGRSLWFDRRGVRYTMPVSVSVALSAAVDRCKLLTNRDGRVLTAVGTYARRMRTAYPVRAGVLRYVRSRTYRIMGPHTDIPDPTRFGTVFNIVVKFEQFIKVQKVFLILANDESL